MPAVSVSQRRLMGVALSIKRGHTPASYSPEAAKIAGEMSEAELEKFAGKEKRMKMKNVSTEIKESAHEEKETIRRYTKRRTHIKRAAKAARGETRLRLKADADKFTEIIKDEKEHLDEFSDMYYGITGTGI
jgi:rubrerythrin